MKDKLSLTALQLMIRDSVVLAMPGSYWVTAEIAELKENYSGHCYLELVDKDPVTDVLNSRARATIWAARYRLIGPMFESSSGLRLAAGMKVLLRVTVEYHEIYGMSLNISDIDPAYTIGEMSLKRSGIIRRLKEEGVWDMNSQRDFPSLPQRIAVISSASAAGYTDFRKQLAENTYGYRFVTRLFTSPMQGEDTEKGIVAALDSIAEQPGEFDVAVILRGGGSVADLHWFDNYPVAFHITQFPIPVLTGIGHEKDVSVTDMVAWKALKTPTAVATFLVEKMHETDLMIADAADRLKTVSREIIMEHSSLTIENARRILPATKDLISDTEKNLSTTALALASLTRGRIKEAGILTAIRASEIKSSLKQIFRENASNLDANSQRLKTGTRTILLKLGEELASLEEHLRISDPVNILKKGFTITMSGGRTVRDAKSLRKGDTIATRFCDGYVESTVKEKSKTKGNDEERVVLHPGDE
jgi:exodeoxyribonuclease VII large subunit